jgi:hypothetical protein
MTIVLRVISGIGTRASLECDQPGTKKNGGNHAEMELSLGKTLLRM